MVNVCKAGNACVRCRYVCVLESVHVVECVCTRGNQLCVPCGMILLTTYLECVQVIAQVTTHIQRDHVRKAKHARPHVVWWW